MGLLDLLGFSSEQNEPSTDGSYLNEVYEPLSLSDKNPENRRFFHERFNANYTYLKKQLPKKWQTVLKEVSLNPRGVELIANMPENVDIDMRSFFSLGDESALYFHDKNVLELSSIDENGKTGIDGDLDPYCCLLHECRHAMQDRLGLRLGINGNSAQDLAYNNLLIEADAYAFANSEAVIQDVFKTVNPTQRQVQTFMKKDLLQESFLKLNTQSIHPSDLIIIKERIAKKIQETPTYRFQQQLKKSGGNVARARMAFRSQEFKKYWSSGLLFDSGYEQQALNSVIYAMQEGNLQKQGQKDVVSKIYKQIAKENGVSVSEIENGLNVSPAFKKCLDYAEKHPELSAIQMHQSFDRIYDNEDKSGNLTSWIRRQIDR